MILSINKKPRFLDMKEWGFINFGSPAIFFKEDL